MFPNVSAKVLTVLVSSPASNERIVSSATLWPCCSNGGTEDCTRYPCDPTVLGGDHGVIIKNPEFRNTRPMYTYRKQIMFSSSFRDFEIVGQVDKDCAMSFSLSPKGMELELIVMVSTMGLGFKTIVLKGKWIGPDQSEPQYDALERLRERTFQLFMIDELLHARLRRYRRHRLLPEETVYLRLSMNMSRLCRSGDSKFLIIRA